MDFHFKLVAPPVPALRRGIRLREELAVLQVGDHILLFNLITAGLLAGIVAGYLSALQQIPGSGFADVADPVKLGFCDSVGNIVPVDGFVVQGNTPFKIRYAGVTVLVLPCYTLFFPFFPQFFPKMRILAHFPTHSSLPETPDFFGVSA